MDTILTIISKIFPMGTHISHINCAIALVKSLLITWTVNLLHLSELMSDKAKPLSSMRRLQRFLALKTFSKIQAGRAILHCVAGPGPYVLSMDRTSWELGKRVYNILAIGVCFDGIALPVFFAMYDKDGTTSFSEQVEFMENALDVIGASNVRFLIADREFGNGNFIKWLKFRGIKFCLRLRSNLWMRDLSNNKVGQIGQQFHSLAEGDSVVLRNAFLMGKGVTVRVYATRRVGRDKEDSLIILASPIDCDVTADLYKLRWTLETSFRGLKTAGFHVEDTHLDLERFSSMFLMALIAFAAAFKDGLVKESRMPIRIQKKTGRKVESTLRYGLRDITYEIWMVETHSNSNAKILT